MEIKTCLIWGNEEMTTIFANSFTKDVCLRFRFSLDVHMPESLSSRIVAFYDYLPVQEKRESSTDISLMREAIHSLLEQVWSHCTTQPSVRLQDIVIEIYQDSRQKLRWRVSHEGSLGQYIESLLPLSHLFEGEAETDSAKANTIDQVHRSTLLPIEMLEGRGISSLVRSSFTPGVLHVFKGAGFDLVLESPTDFNNKRNAFYHEP
jgi:hypothetical protein